MGLWLRSTYRLGKSESTKRQKHIVGFGLFMGIVDNNKNIEYC